jgi:hypothetical protein
MLQELRQPEVWGCRQHDLLTSDTSEVSTSSVTSDFSRDDTWDNPICQKT